GFIEIFIRKINALEIEEKSWPGICYLKTRDSQICRAAVLIPAPVVPSSGRAVNNYSEIKYAN
ncbi:MAG: hypothetical protein ACREXO_02095, partial [Advenella sp.]